MLGNPSNFLTFIALNTLSMNEKIKKLFHLMAMAAALIAIVVFAIIHAQTAMDSQYGALVLIAYVLMFIWAACRVIVLFKEYRRLK